MKSLAYCCVLFSTIAISFAASVPCHARARNFGWLAQTGGSVLSYGNNSIDGNVGNQSPPPTLSLK